MKDTFVHLRVHSEYSLLRSVARIKDLVKKAKEFKMPALAITDHGTMSGVVPFYKACREEGIKPIIGCEVFVTNAEEKRQRAYSLNLLAESNEGYQNLIKLVTQSHLTSQGLPAITKNVLEKHIKGLIALSSGLRGEIAQAILGRSSIEAKKITAEYIDIFTHENFFLEIQDHQKREQQIINRQLITLAKELRIGLVATNEVHYIDRSDSKAYQCISCIRTGSKLVKETESIIGTNNYFASPEEMRSIFSYIPSAIENTVRIAKRCEVILPFGVNLLPEFPVPSGRNSKDFLRDLCSKGVIKRYPSFTEEIKKRLDYELSVIHQMNLDDYFLVVWDFVRYAYKEGIAVGPGRGSAAGSIVCYVLGITNIDPIRYNLLFERFLNPDRVSMPDIDLDFSDERREELIFYAKEKYGIDYVAQIVTFGTLAPRAAIRDLGRVMDLPYHQVDQLAKKVLPHSKSVRVFLEAEQDSAEIKNLLHMVQKVEGLPRHISTHAAGLVISGKPLTEYVPLQEGSGVVSLTQYPMEVLEEIGLLKIDFLGLRNLSLIEKTRSFIHDMGEKVPAITNYDDLKTYELLSKGETVGVFQLESSGMRKVLQKVRPRTFEDLIAVVALYRPGPMEQIPRFIEAKNGVKNVTYPHKDLEEILAPTYGVIIYQEQIIQIASKIAGFTLSQADMLRRAVSKKRYDELKMHKGAFIEGCMKKGYGEKTGKKIYDLIVRFANYGFNRSHSVAYAALAYETAYLKANFPLPFMTALLTTVMGNQSKLGEYIGEARRLGMRLLPPDINKSQYGFSIQQGEISFGFGAIKYVGTNAIRSILEARKEGLFQSTLDFCRRVDMKVCNRKVLESLIQCGTMDKFPGHRSLKVALLDEMMEEGLLQGVSKDQAFLFHQQEPRHPDLNVRSYSKEEMLEYEMELLGVYVSGHPLDHYEGVNNRTQINQLSTLAHKMKTVIIGIITKIKGIKTKKGEYMAFCTLQDRTGSIEVVVFPRVYMKSKELILEEVPVKVEGEVQVTKGDIQFIASEVRALKRKSARKVFIQILDNHESKLENLKNTLLSYPGSVPVYLFYQQNKKTVALPVEKYGISPTQDCINQINSIFKHNVFHIKEVDS